MINCGKNGYLGGKKIRHNTNFQFLAHQLLSGSFNNLENDCTKNLFIGFQLKNELKKLYDTPIPGISV